MQKKNKIVIQITPVKSPSPDVRNHNRIVSTQIQTNTLKRYQQSISNIYQKENDKLNKQFIQDQLQWYSSKKSQSNTQFKSNQEILRKRIIQLEIQNNQFRQIAKEFQDLSNKNKELQQKMLMLLSELEYSHSQPKNQSRSFFNSILKPQTIDACSTIQNLRTQQSKYQAIKNINEIKQFQHEQSFNKHFSELHFENIKIEKNKSESKQNLMRQKQLKKQIDFQINNSIESFQSVFIKLVKLLDTQLKQLKINNQQIQNLSLLKSSSSEGDIEVCKEQYSNICYKINKPLGQSSIYKQKKSYHSRGKNQDQSSQVDIKIFNISDSQRSFGSFNKSNHVKQRIGQQLKNKFQSRDKSIDESIRYNSNYTDRIMEKVIQNIETIKYNLSIIQTEQNTIKSTRTIQFQNKVFQRLQDILTTFFPHKKMHNSSLICQQNIRQSIMLRQKIKFTNSGILNQTERKNQQEVYNLVNNIEDEGGNNYQLNLNPSHLYSQQFQETKGKLLQIIDIMKSLNQEYRKILSENVKTKHKESSRFAPNTHF